MKHLILLFVLFFPVILSAQNVGIGTSTPTSPLEVIGEIKGTTLKITNGAGPGKVLVSDGNGLASWTNANTLPGSIASSSSLAGTVNGAVPTTANNFEFVGPTVTVTLTANQRVTMTGYACLGRNLTGPAAAVSMDVGYQLQSGGTIYNAANGNYANAIVNETAYLINQYMGTGSFKPGVAGIYKIGLVLRSSTPGFFNNNTYVNASYTIINE